MTLIEKPAIVSFRYDIRVRYADTDQMQIVYNGKYLEYFEVGRTELIRSLGLPYAEMERRGTRLPLIEAYCRFHRPARYDDIITVESSVHEIPRSALRIDYRIECKEPGVLLATGFTKHAFLDIETNRPVRPPLHFIKALENDKTKVDRSKEGNNKFLNKNVCNNQEL